MRFYFISFVLRSMNHSEPLFKNMTIEREDPITSLAAIKQIEGQLVKRYGDQHEVAILHWQPYEKD